MENKETALISSIADLIENQIRLDKELLGTARKNQGKESLVCSVIGNTIKSNEALLGFIKKHYGNL